jgi:pimeloyl-ACP methyl ester carboxylesterase
MPRLARPDGIELHWEERGEGPLVVLAPYWSGHPEVYADLLDELARDHRVVTWDARGTGGSTRAGPFDMPTGVADFGAIVEAFDGAAVVLATADGANRAVHLAAERPELVEAVISLATAPMSRETFEGTEAMLASSTVIDAFLQMLGRDYRAALRTVLAAGNPQMSEPELHERVEFQSSYCPQEVAIARVRDWADDDPSVAARQMGGRLWILASPDIGGWLPPLEQLRDRLAELMPEARLVEGRPDEGPLSRPDVTADLVRQVTGVRA